MVGLDADLSTRLDYELMVLKQQREEYAAQLDKMHDCKNTILHRTKRGGRNYYYYAKKPGSQFYCYLGRSSRSEVKRIRKARFLAEAIRRIDHDIDLMTKLRFEFLPFDAPSVSRGLPDIYCGEEVPPASDLYKQRAAEWLNHRLEFQSRFPENYPQHKRHTTSDGVKVKTISELLIYERFRSAGLVQIYELPLMPKDYGPALYPDFTILSPVDMKTEIIVEFVGRMDLREYREDFAKRIHRYMESGFIPNVNLFLIFSDSDGNIDSLQITKVIADIFGLRREQLS